MSTKIKKMTKSLNRQRTLFVGQNRQNNDKSSNLAAHEYNLKNEDISKN